MPQNPKFPISGQIISNNVALDRISLIYNPVANNYFFSAEYAFFTKNANIWYKYKNPNGTWSNEFLWIANGYSSNTKFDSRGLPITAYIQKNGALGVVYFDQYVNLQTTTIATSGSNPTVAINSLDTYIFWVPSNYSTYIQYCEIDNHFLYAHNYDITLPGSIENMQIETTSDDKFIFSFEVLNGDIQKIYVANTLSAM